MNNIFANKKVLVTGGTGMIGRPLVDLLLERGAVLRVVSLDPEPNLPVGVAYLKLDLTQFDACREACQGMNYVFHLAGIKGGVGIGRKQGARFLEGNAFINMNMLKAAREAGVERYLFTSTIGVYPDAELFKEDEVWQKPPHPSDWYGAWAKRFGELQCEAYYEQYRYKTCIVRPANVYGPFDNFNLETAMVIPALIARVLNGENPICVWGDGSVVRDFIFSRDCARGMLMVMERYYECDPINLGTGIGATIRDVVEAICRYAPHPPNIEWDISKPTGNRIRLMDVTKAREKVGFQAEYELDQGIRETMDWYLANKNRHATNRSNLFT